MLLGLGVHNKVGVPGTPRYSPIWSNFHYCALSCSALENVIVMHLIGAPFWQKQTVLRTPSHVVWCIAMYCIAVHDHCNALQWSSLVSRQCSLLSSIRGERPSQVSMCHHHHHQQHHQHRHHLVCTNIWNFVKANYVKGVIKFYNDLKVCWSQWFSCLTIPR